MFTIPPLRDLIVKTISYKKIFHVSCETRAIIVLYLSSQNFVQQCVIPCSHTGDTVSKSLSAIDCEKSFQAPGLSEQNHQL